MKITVCEIRNRTDILEQEWQQLVSHVQSEGSEMVLLPEMPFYPWIAQTDNVYGLVWQASVDMHERWLPRCAELTPATVMSSRPVTHDGKQLNEGFIMDEVTGYKAVHHKYYLPDEEGWWEASWYERGEKDFTAIQSPRVRLGFLICTELWFCRHARDYAGQGVELLVCPRATGVASNDKWIAGGRAAAVVSGAYCLSSNLSHCDGDTMPWGRRRVDH